MTGFGGLPVAEAVDEGATQWAGTSKILGPKWLQLPALTVGLLGVQVLWSVEMSQGADFDILKRMSFSSVVSFTIPYQTGPVEISDSYCLPCRTSIWPHCAASDWYACVLKARINSI